MLPTLEKLSEGQLGESPLGQTGAQLGPIGHRTSKKFKTSEVVSLVLETGQRNPPVTAKQHTCTAIVWSKLLTFRPTGIRLQFYLDGFIGLIFETDLAAEAA
jgi:hypothetical protein